MRILLALLLVCFSASAATTTYYLDSDWTGTQSGTQAQPFKSLTAGAWTTINTALGSGPVIVYFSARKAGSDTDQIYSATGSTTTPDEIDVSAGLSAGNANLLTIDCKSLWNQNDGSPLWATYVGSSKCRIKSWHTDNGSHVIYNNWKLYGAHLVAPHTLKGANVAGTNIWIDSCVVEQTDASASANNPLVQLIPTADGTHQGSGFYAGTPCFAIFFVNNELFNSSAECFYIGAGGDNGSGGQPTCSTQGYPTHHDVWVTNNFIHDSAHWPGSDQGDGIDCKGGLTNLYVGYNIISNLPDSNAAGIRGIVTQGQVCPGPNWNVNIFANRIYNVKAEDGVVTFANSWGTPGDVHVYDNIIVNNVNGSGIRFYPGQGGNSIFNNTIVSNADVAIRIDSGQTCTITNNLMFNNTGGQLDISGTGTHGNNGYTAPLGVTAAPSDFTSTSAANFNNAAALDYSLLSTAPAIGAGRTVAYANYDIIGTPRPQGTKWDVGAYQFRNFIPVITNVTLIMK